MSAGSTQPIRLGIIGTGLAVEKLHWPALRQLGDRYAVTAFAERSRSNAERFASYSGVDPGRRHRDYRDLLSRDDVDAALICLPIPLLYGAARDALAAGKHVFCEKPTGTDEEQGRAFLRLATDHPDQVVLVGENMFYRDDIRFARSLVDAGAIGRPYLLSWRTVSRLVPREGSFSGTRWRQQPQYRGGAHLDAGVHHVAQIRMLAGDARRVHGLVQWANSTIDAPSVLTLNLQFVSGAVGNYTASYPEIPVPPEPGGLRLYGSEGVLTMGARPGAGDGGRGGPGGRVRLVSLLRADETGETHEFSGSDNGYQAELRNFYEAVRHGAPVVGTVEQSFTTMVTILRGLDSAERGEAVSLDDLPVELGRVPLWRPAGAGGLFDGLPGHHEVARD